MLLNGLMVTFYFLVAMKPQFNKVINKYNFAHAYSDTQVAHITQKRSLSPSCHYQFNKTSLFGSTGNYTINIQLKTISKSEKREKNVISRAKIFFRHWRVQSAMTYYIYSYKGLSNEYKQRSKIKTLIIRSNNLDPMRC